MAFHRFIARALDGEPIQLIGDGRQTRDFTYVGDAVDGHDRCGRRGRAGAVYNVGGGNPVELNDAIALIGELVAAPLEVERLPALVGEANRTACDGSLARRELGFVPRTPLAAGLSEQLLHMAGERRRLAELHRSSSGRDRTSAAQRAGGSPRSPGARAHSSRRARSRTPGVRAGTGASSK